jgi:8-oxo-dGTP pyrophosphatase MutT (NUDIX family)
VLSLTILQQLLKDHRPVPTSPELRCAAVAVIVHERDDDLYVLLLKRAEHPGDPWSGHISLPGGRYESTDQNLQHTAIREAFEETAIDLQAEAGVTCLGHSDPLHPLSAGPRGMEVTPFVFVVDRVPAIRLSREATDYFWMPLRKALSGEFSSEIQIDRTSAGESQQMRFPSWEFQGFVIWGLTMRVLSLLAPDALR